MKTRLQRVHGMVFEDDSPYVDPFFSRLLCCEQLRHVDRPHCVSRMHGHTLTGSNFRNSTVEHAMNVAEPAQGSCVRRRISLLVTLSCQRMFKIRRKQRIWYTLHVSGVSMAPKILRLISQDSFHLTRWSLGL